MSEASTQDLRQLSENDMKVLRMILSVSRRNQRENRIKNIREDLKVDSTDEVPRFYMYE